MCFYVYQVRDLNIQKLECNIKKKIISCCFIITLFVLWAYTFFNAINNNYFETTIFWFNFSRWVFNNKQMYLFSNSDITNVSLFLLLTSINCRKSTMIILQTEMISFLSFFSYDHILYVNIERGFGSVCFLRWGLFPVPVAEIWICCSWLGVNPTNPGPLVFLTNMHCWSSDWGEIPSFCLGWYSSSELKYVKTRL